MSEEMRFFIYLLEYYSRYKNMNTGRIMNDWKEKGLVQKIYNNYWLYHTERIENAFDDIDSLMETGKSAW